MHGELLPNFPADAKNLISLINFVTDTKLCGAWMKAAKEVIARNQKLLSTIGKAAEIDKLHAEATELKKVVLGAIEKREKALAEDWDKFDAERVKRRAAMQKEEHDAGARATAQRDEVTRLLSDAKMQNEAAAASRKDALEAQAQTQRERDAAKALREELEAQRDQVKKLAGAVAA